MTGIEDKCQSSKENLSSEQNSSLNNEIHDIINPKIPERKGRGILNLLKNDKKLKASRHFVQTSIWRGGLGILNMEYIIKLSNTLL